MGNNRGWKEEREGQGGRANGGQQIAGFTPSRI